LGHQIKKNETDGAHSTYGGDELNKGSWWGDLRDGDHLEDPGVDGRGREGIILKWIFK